MVEGYGERTTVSDEDRREFLKVLGVSGSIAAGGLGLEELGSTTGVTAAEELAPVGQAIRTDLTGAIDADLVAEQQAALTAASEEMAATVERGLPSEAPREEFATVADAGWPVYEHLREVGFYASADEQLPAFDVDTLGAAMETFVASDQLVGMVEEFGLGDHQGVDLLATVIGNAEQLQNYHWVATEEVPGGVSAPSDAFPTAPQAAAGGALLWLEDVDEYLYQNEIILTEEIHADAAWHGETMAAGLHLMSEAARVIGEGAGALSDAELASLLTVSFAVQATAQGLITQDVYWVTEEMRAPRAGGDN